MKINIEVDASLTESEVLIRCPSLNEEIQMLQEALNNAAHCPKKLACFQNNKEYYIPLEHILFFETESGRMHAHTASDVFITKLKLYELEELLPGSFVRISKSAILNTNHVYSITKNLTASSVVEFAGTHKQVYVSRHYYKPLKFKLEEKRNYYET